MTLRLTLGLAVLALGLALAALAGIPALIENRTVGDVAVVTGFAVAVFGLVLALSGIPAEVRAARRRKADEARRAADTAADRANLKIKRRRIQLTKADVLVRLIEAREEVERLRRGNDVPGLRRQQLEVRQIELENVVVEANLQFNANEFGRHGLDVEGFDGEPDAQLGSEDSPSSAPAVEA